MTLLLKLWVMAINGGKKEKKKRISSGLAIAVRNPRTKKHPPKKDYRPAVLRVRGVCGDPASAGCHLCEEA
ncbi:hypothetical protein [Erwinia tasmaniensis]|uniref:hypothetical protein n=1 Tax=Erwinia tasmaniensis TaxID=338565 RepID=UPI0012FF3809|nr:hypothetical protein [Erwinia tasmaniensis]